MVLLQPPEDCEGAKHGRSPRISWRSSPRGGGEEQQPGEDGRDPCLTCNSRGHFPWASAPSQTHPPISLKVATHNFSHSFHCGHSVSANPWCKNSHGRVPTVVQWDWWRLCSTRMQVRSPAQHNGLKDPVLPQWHWLQLWLGSDPGLGTPHVLGQPKSKQTKKHNNNSFDDHWCRKPSGIYTNTTSTTRSLGKW